jgi:farnesyl-diphosphate farnesyltransferase
MHPEHPLPADKLTLLRGVSRSFYVSIRLLPRPLREPVAAAYLLARATDTIADTTQLAPPARREKLATLGAAIEGDAAARAAISELATSFAALQQDPDERALILALPQCLAWLDALGNADQRDVRTVLRHITLGQALDIERFGNDAQVCALATAAELEEYTWLVAGCVGEFWTDLCFRHVPGFASLPQEEMRALGRAYGSGLQLINILRDAGADLAAGRCYFPADDLAMAALAPQDILREPARLAGLYGHWLQQAGDRDGTITRMTPQQYVQEKAAASGSSFYYAFLFLPKPAARRHHRVLCFCREVDDVVDEVTDPASPAPSWPGGRARWPVPSRAKPSHPVMKALMPLAADFGIEARHLLP